LGDCSQNDAIFSRELRVKTKLKRITNSPSKLIQLIQLLSTRNQKRRNMS